jgi:hypothetical protein
MSQSFQVIVRSLVSHSPVEWQRILEADEAGGLSRLTDNERSIAQRLGLEEKEVAEKIKAGQYGELRVTAKGLGLGESAEAILKHLPGCKLESVLWEGSKDRWVLRIATPEKTVNLPVPAELADDVVDANSAQDLERLKNLVLFGVGRQDLIFER